MLWANVRYECTVKNFSWTLGNQLVRVVYGRLPRHLYADWWCVKVACVLFIHHLQTCLNTLRPKQNGRHLPDDILKCIFLNENIWISIDISLKFVHRGPINNIPTLFQVMAWRRPGNKPLSEPMMVRLPMHIYITRPQCLNAKCHVVAHLLLF